MFSLCWLLGGWAHTHFLKNLKLSIELKVGDCGVKNVRLKNGLIAQVKFAPLLFLTVKSEFIHCRIYLSSLRLFLILLSAKLLLSKH